jgi:hypothetical protein
MTNTTYIFFLSQDNFMFVFVDSFIYIINITPHAIISFVKTNSQNRPNS